MKWPDLEERTGYVDTAETRRFPLRDAYEFAAERGLGAEAAAIKDMEIEWDKSYTSTVRRGYLIRLLKDKGVFDDFVASRWRTGLTAQGQGEIKQCIRVGDQYTAFLNEPAGTVPNNGDGIDGRSEPSGLEFALEAHLRDFLARNLERLEQGLQLAADSEKPPVEYPVDGGRIDILARDREGRYVVIELKLSRGRNRALGQLLYYMGWVDQQLRNGPCRGIIVAADISDDLRTAVARAPGVTLARYNMSFSVELVQ